jgi:hypothetical protein
MTQLSPHFSLAEFTFSSTAKRMNIDNDAPPAVVENLKRTANGLERVRQLLNGNAIRISSGYRSPRLNAAVNGQPKSQHLTGQAVDFTSPYGTPDQIVRLIKSSGMDFDQLIAEFGSWVHISFADNPRQQVLVIDRFGVREFK